MLLTSIILFAVAAVFGLTLIIPLLQNKSVSKSRAVTHGLFAAVALVILIIFSINSETGSPVASIVLFVIAALGGFVLFSKHLKNGNPGPKGLALVHAGAAVVGFLILLVFFLSM